MKILCLSDLDRFRLSRTKKTFKDLKTNEYYIFKESCYVCKEPYMKSKRSSTNCCSLSCAQSGDLNHEFGKNKELNPWFNKKHTEDTLKKISMNSKGKNNSSWKGGVISKNLPAYDTYAHQLNFIEDVGYEIKDDIKLLKIRCKKCNKWFIPSRVSVRHRLSALNNVNNNKENNFYCSENCKKKCSIFRSNGKVIKLSDDYGLRIWSKEILKRANYCCEYCGRKATLAHHIRPKKLEPGYALDLDNGIACCNKCHNKYGHRDECSFINLSRIKCNKGGMNYA